MTQPSGTPGFSHLLIEADAELALVPLADAYLGTILGTEHYLLAWYTKKLPLITLMLKNL